MPIPSGYRSTVHQFSLEGNVPSLPALGGAREGIHAENRLVISVQCDLSPAWRLSGALPLNRPHRKIFKSSPFASAILLTKTMASINLSTWRVTSSLIRAAYRSSQQQLGCDDVGRQCLLRRYVSLSPLSSRSGQCRRKASTYSSYRETTELSEDVDPSSSLTIPGPTESMVQSFDPVKKSRARKVPLPRSR